MVVGKEIQYLVTFNMAIPTNEFNTKLSSTVHDASKFVMPNLNKVAFYVR